MNDVSAGQPWYREFWPWFVIALLGSAVLASLVTVWIAVAAAPDRVDGAGMLAIEAHLSADRKTLEFDLGLPPPDAAWPEAIRVTIDPRSGAPVQRLLARRIDERLYQAAVGELEPGSHDIILEADGSPMTLRGNWAYPAPVWKLRVDE